jgi:4-amino-4-deoxy-L-arabinose transferase-like glycosyltransferase
MAEPTKPSGAVSTLGYAGRLGSALARPASLAFLLELALLLRVLAADAVEWYVRRGGADRLCLFPDTNIYWELARTIRLGTPYEVVEFSDIPHFAKRTPGYPLFLAACQTLFGDRTLAVRLVQAVLGTVSVYLVYCLSLQFAEPGVPLTPRLACRSGLPAVPLAAAALAALHPYYILMSSFILSEVLFEPLMLAALLGLAMAWKETSSVRALGLVHPSSFILHPFMAGVAAGLAVLVRPSWGLFLPLVLAVWVIAQARGRLRRSAAVRGALVCALGAVLVMSPWWARNARTYGRFVPAALWLGASLYDGLNPAATGASNMKFRENADIWPLDEQDQDAELVRRAVDFAREQPARVLSLALVKLGRFWRPWPNAEGLRSPVVNVAGAVLGLPIFGLMALGIWDHRRDPRAWALCAGPVLYFCALHLVFASSMRYRIPGEMPALSLAGIGCMKLVALWRQR